MFGNIQYCACPLQDAGPSVYNNGICSSMSLFILLIEKIISRDCQIATPCKTLTSEETLLPVYDFIVVGAGPAGSIVASRLSEDPKVNVLLLEAGGNEPISARVPGFYRLYWYNTEVNWLYRTIPANYCLDQKGQGCFWPRGKVIGGSNVLNGMMYHRGHPADYEDWVREGAIGWSWEENLPYFDKTEGNKDIGKVVSKEYHSADGPLPIQQFRYQPPFTYALLAAINETGLPVIADLNDLKTPDGFAIAQAMTTDGQRYTAARAFLKPKTERPNLSVKLYAHVTKVLFQGKRAVGVEFIDTKTGETTSVYADKEVILSAGALNTPQILMLSGVGPKETLEKFEIPVVANLAVGKNLRNHYGPTLYFIFTKLKNTEVLDLKVFNQYLKHKDGPMSATGITQLTGILYSSLADRLRLQPDIQYFFNGFYAECSKTGIMGEPIGSCPLCGLNISVNAPILKPRSVGYVTLASKDPLAPPIFDPNFFSAPEDLVMIKDAVRYLRRIFDSDILQNKYGVILDRKTTRNCVDAGEEWSDDWVECIARFNTDPQNHQIGTAAIGRVIDPLLKVYGLQGLRVIDASAVPTQPTGNPQASIMMLAERGADFIKRYWKIRT